MKVNDTYIEDNKIALLIKLLANNWIGRIAIKIALKKIHTYPRYQIKEFVFFCKIHK